MEHFQENIKFILCTLWILFAISVMALPFICTVVETTKNSKILAIVVTVVLFIIAFLLQNVYIYLYQ